MDRIAVIGCSGGGKSTLTRRLAERTGLPVVHLDVVFWRPGWVESDDESFRERLSAALAGGRWITDGNFMRMGDLHIAGAELIVWVDQPRGLCIRRALLRAVREHGRKRPDMAEGCEERIDLAFLKYIWTWNRLQRPKVELRLRQFAPRTPIVKLRSDAEIENWIEAFVQA